MQHVVSQLKTKKSELQGELDFHLKKVEQLRQAVESVNISIKLFEPDFKLENVKSKKFKTKSHYFKRGEAQRYILDYLRKTQSAKTTTEITKSLMQKKGLDYEDQELQSGVQKSILHSIRNLEKDKTIRSVSFDHGSGITWELCS